MPTTYAHYSFGADCILKLPTYLKEIIEENRNIFNIGVHGPDIFFYYKPLKKMKINAFGSKMHQAPAEDFFREAKKTYTKYTDKKNEMLAYLLGFLSHFTLDASCHSYIEHKKEVSKVSHNRIESQYDAYLIKKSNKASPEHYDRSHLVDPQQEYAAVLARFFPFSEDIMYDVIKGQRGLLGFFYSPLGIKRKFIQTILRLLHIKGNFDDLFLEDASDKRCLDSNLRLDKLYAAALNKYKKLAANFMDFLNDQAELDPYFKHNFDQWDNYKLIPILSPEEERLFIIPTEG